MLGNDRLCKESFNMQRELIQLIGYASDVAAASGGSHAGPGILKDSPYLNDLKVKLNWLAMLEPDMSHASKSIIVHYLCKELAALTEKLVQEKKFFTVIGGDHTSAIGTWSGVSHAKRTEGPIGLIWIDAHLDSHTPATSETGNLHGMPLACLLGYGDSSLTQLYKEETYLKPQNICLIGARSYEAAELALLQKLNVRIFFMDEVKKRGIQQVMIEALHIVSAKTVGFGISLDIDSIDPKDAPGTAMRVLDGIPGNELITAFTLLANNQQCLGMEIVEFDPSQDKAQMTEKLIVNLMRAIM